MLYDFAINFSVTSKIRYLGEKNVEDFEMDQKRLVGLLMEN